MSFEEIQKNAEKIAEGEYEARLKRCVPIAKKINAMIAAGLESITMGESNDARESMDPLAKDVLQLFLDENVLWSDRTFIFQLATQPIVYLTEIVNASLDKSWDKAVDNRFGKSYLELTMQEVDGALKKSVV